MRHSLAVFVVLAAAPATAQTLTPTVAFSVHDEPVDGVGDSFNMITGLVRTQSTRADRAMQEFAAGAFAGWRISSATLSGRITVNNAADVGVRAFEFSLYVGDGVADLGDYAVPSTPIGLGSYHPPNTTFFDFVFDVRDEVQAIVDCGATHVGLKVVGTSNPNFPNILSNTVAQLTIVASGPQPPWTDLGFATGGASGAPRLVGHGTLSPGNVTSLTLCDVPPSAAGVLIIGLTRIDFPLLGITLVPLPELSAQMPISTLGTSHLSLSFGPPAGGGLPFWFQYVMLDPTAPMGIAASNALTTVAP